MSLWDRVTSMIALAPWDHPERIELSETIDEQFARATRQAAPRPWRPASTSEALGVPAIFGVVTSIANVCSTLSMRGLRNGVEMEERPRLLIRPDPYKTTRDFLRETVWPMAVYGEAWWWVATRSQGMATSLIPVDPREVTVEAPHDDWLRPVIRWRGKPMPRDDMRQIVHSREPGGLRGFGPLQACGAAISISVEAQEWAANFYADGGNPSVNLHSELELEADEAASLREQWVETPANMPQVTSGPLLLREIGGNVDRAQMLEARTWNVGDVARMFNYPGSLIEFAREGASLTYQNVASEFDKLMKACLLPNYLEPIEQAMSDLLPRDIVARFNQDAILRADVKTRYEVYGMGASTVDPITGEQLLTVREARAMEGRAPGDIENAPMPASPPSAMPGPIPLSMREIRCRTCKRLLGRAEGAAELRCAHCKSVQLSAA